MVVLTALAMSVAGLLESLAAKHAEEAAVRTQERSVSTMAAFRRAQQQAQVALETLAAAQELHVRAGSLQQRLLATGAAPGRQALALARDRWQKTAGELDRLSGIKAGAWESPERDTDFPLRFLQRTWRARDYEFALQDAAVEDFLLWKRLVNYYAAILMVLSVALYLFGLALATRTPEAKGFFKRVATWLLAVGVLAGFLVSAQFGNAAWGQRADRSGEKCLLSAQERDELGLGEDGGMAPAGVPDADRHAVEGQAVTRAASCYAAGSEAYSLNRYTTATDLLAQAAAARPHFGYAYLLRANANYDSGSLSVSGPTSVADVRYLKLAIDDFNRARRFMREDPIEGEIGDAYLQLVLLGAAPSSGTDPWWLVLLNDRERIRSWRLNTAIRLTNDAIGQDPDNRTARYNLGVALLARDGAVTNENRAKFQDAANRTRGLSDSTMWSAFTDLEKIAEVRPDQKGAVQETKENILQLVAGQKPAGGAPAVGTTTRIDVLPVGLRWTACLSGFDPARDKLVAVWYYGPSAADSKASRPGTVLEGISGRTDPVRLGNCGHSGTGYSKMRIFSPGTPEPRCVQRGWYRVELYRNGRLIDQGQRNTDRDFPELAKSTALDQEEGMCQPKAWTRYAASVIGFVDGFVAPDHTRGVFTYRFQHLMTREEDWNATAAFYVERALSDLLPSSPGLTSRPCTTLSFHRLERQHDPWHRNAWYRYGRDGCVYTRADLFDTGTVVVDLVFGPESYFAGREPFDLLESVWIIDPSILQSVSIVAPVPDTRASNPVRLVVGTMAALGEGATASPVDSLQGTRSRVSLHVAVDSREFMPGAAEWKQLTAGRYEYRLPALAPGSHTVRVYWADSVSHKPRGAAQTVSFTLNP